MKKFVLIGASGFIGSAILKEAINRGHDVTAVCRNPEKITLKSNNLMLIKADVASAETVAVICNGFDTVISAYNPGWTNPKIAEETLSGYTSILAGAKKAGVRRLLCVGGAGTLFYKPGVRLVDAGILPADFLPAVNALGNLYLKILTNENLIDWIFFSPAQNIAPGKRTGKFRLGKDDLIVNEKGESSISVEDYAVAMVDEFEKEAHHRERFTIGY
jgi:putative NADH-flavin reductase